MRRERLAIAFTARGGDVQLSTMPSDAPDGEPPLPDPASVSAMLDEVAAESRFLDPVSAEQVAESYFESPSSSLTAVEGYWVNEPYAYVAVGLDPDTDEHHYRVVEPTLDADEQYVRDDLAGVVRTNLLETDLDPADTTDDEFHGHLDAALEPYQEHLPTLTRHKLHYYLDRDFTGLGALDPFMRDPAVEDLSCDGTDVPLYVYLQDYGHTETNRQYPEERLSRMVRRLAQAGNRHLSASRPLLTTTLPDGSRVQLTLGADVATRGTNFTIRKFRTEPFTPIDLVEYGTTTVRELAYLWFLIEHNASIVFAGPTASGKTTTMNAVGAFVPPTDKVVSIEETRELRLPTNNWVATLTRESDLGAERPTIDTYELLSEALHQRPDYILVGEIRTDPDVARTFFQAIGTGHAGFTTFHADSGDDVLRRLSHDPLSVPPELLSHLDVICVQELFVDDDRVRRIRSLHEVEPATDPDARPTLREVFSFDVDTGTFHQTGASRLLAEFAADQGWSTDDLYAELDRRMRLLSTLVDRGPVDYQTVANTLFRYHRNPNAVLDECPAHETPDIELTTPR